MQRYLLVFFGISTIFLGSSAQAKSILERNVEAASVQDTRTYVMGVDPQFRPATAGQEVMGVDPQFLQVKPGSPYMGVDPQFYPVRPGTIYMGVDPQF